MNAKEWRKSLLQYCDGSRAYDVLRDLETAEKERDMAMRAYETEKAAAKRERERGNNLFDACLRAIDIEKNSPYPHAWQEAVKVLEAAVTEAEQ